MLTASFIPLKLLNLDSSPQENDTLQPFAEKLTQLEALVDYVFAVREYQECIDLDATDVVAINNKGLCLMYLRDLDDGIKVLGFGYFSYAHKLFDEMPVKDVSGNTVSSSFFGNGLVGEGFGWFNTMYGNTGVCRFDQGSVTTVLSVCDGWEFANVVKLVHGLVVLHGYDQEMTVVNALITACYGSWSFGEGRWVFVEIRDGDRNVVTWTAMISGLAQFCEESLEVFVEMRKGLVSQNTLTYLSLLMACS